MTENNNVVKDLKKLMSNYCFTLARTIQRLHPKASPTGHLIIYILLLIRRVLRTVVCFKMLSAGNNKGFKKQNYEIQIASNIALMKPLQYHV